jgi:hypothetical protein
VATKQLAKGRMARNAPHKNDTPTICIVHSPTNALFIKLEKV